MTADLTEETEDIILQRAKNDVDRSEFLTEQARERHERSTKLDIPRNAEFQAHSLRQALLTWEESRLALASQLQKQKLELEKMQFDHEKAADKLAELKRDREMLTVTAPANGVVHYGRSQNGNWITASAMAQKWFLVGLSAVQLSPTIWYGLRANDTASLPMSGMRSRGVAERPGFWSF